MEILWRNETRLLLDTVIYFETIKEAGKSLKSKLKPAYLLT